MSKKKTNNTEQTQAQNPKVEELLKNGSVTIMANSRNEVYKLSSELIASLPKGTKWDRSCVMFDGDKTFTQKITKID